MRRATVILWKNNFSPTLSSVCTLLFPHKHSTSIVFDKCHIMGNIWNLSFTPSRSCEKIVFGPKTNRKTNWSRKIRFNSHLMFQDLKWEFNCIGFVSDHWILFFLIKIQRIQNGGFNMAAVESRFRIFSKYFINPLT